MTYIKNNWKYYKEIDISKLSKKELLKCVEEAKEIEPNIIIKEVPSKINYPQINQPYNPLIDNPFKYYTSPLWCWIDLAINNTENDKV